MSSVLVCQIFGHFRFFVKFFLLSAKISKKTMPLLIRCHKFYKNVEILPLTDQNREFQSFILEKLFFVFF